MKDYFVKTPKIIQSIFSNFTWKIATNKKEIYLTFDDGPIPNITHWVLNTLNEYNAKATFFCVGENIKKYPAIFQDIIKQNHGVGNHTQNHLNGWKTSNSNFTKNVEMAENFVQKLPPQNADLKLFRPPYGKIKPTQAKILRDNGYKIIMWDVLSADFDIFITKEKCLENVLNNIKRGSIIVFHDNIKAEENLRYALPRTLKYYTEKGYKFRAL